MEETKNRNMLIDAARVVCSLLVIVVHTRLWSDTDFYLGHFLSNVVARMAVPLFFMFAGYFLYTRLSKEEHPVDYLKKYVLNLLRVYVIWSLIYLPYDFSLLLRSGDSYVEAGRIYLSHFFIEGGHFHLWFFPALIYTVLIVGFLYLKDRVKLLGFLAVLFYAIGLVGEPYRTWFAGMPVSADLFRLVHELGTSRSALFFALPFVVWGFSEHKVMKKFGNRMLGTGFLL
ncbi:MAG: acyltransferase family protein [Candidatus Pacebacteria bacterium]|jgi:serine/alanine racemase|nr:acyltransferase family protein [Candidatus Paceibacterota bacterium]